MGAGLIELVVQANATDLVCLRLPLQRAAFVWWQ